MMKRLKLIDSEITRDTAGIIELADSIVSRIIHEHASVGFVVPSANEDESILYLCRESPVRESVIFKGGCHLALIGRFKMMANLSDLNVPQQAPMKFPFSSKWGGYRIKITTCVSYVGSGDRFQIAMITVSIKEACTTRRK